MLMHIFLKRILEKEENSCQKPLSQIKDSLKGLSGCSFGYHWRGHKNFPHVIK